MAKGQKRQDNNTFPKSPKTVDRQMVVPKNYENTQFPVTLPHPRRRELNNGQTPGYANTFEDAPKILNGSSKQSRY